MALYFQIPTNRVLTQPQQTLVKGFGLPLVQRAIIAANVVTQGHDAYKDSKFGTPIFDDLLIEHPLYKEWRYNAQTNKYQEDKNDTSIGSNKTGSSAQGLYVEGCIIDCNMTRNIVTTQISGYNDGTVKEFINNGDWNITIRGYVSTSAPDVYPESDAYFLKQYASAPVSVKLTSNFLNKVFDIQDCVITGLNMFQQQGLRNIQYFEMTLLSDYPFQIVKNA